MSYFSFSSEVSLMFKDNELTGQLKNNSSWGCGLEFVLFNL